jgi:hypothetical protein
MTECETTAIFLSIALCSLGVFLGVVGNKLVSTKNNSKWKFGFYIFGGLSIISAIIYYFNPPSQLNFLYYFILAILFISGICLLIFTRKIIDRKYIYKSSELSPIINTFSKVADNEIKLFGGDFSFLGQSSTEIDQHQQYSFLKKCNFRSILILCEEPKNINTKMRYGKLITELKGVQLRFYNPEAADLQIRGRMKKVQGVAKLLIFSKEDSGKYKTIETDTANSFGALYDNIWNLVWSLAKQPNNVQIEEYKDQFIKR